MIAPTALARAADLLDERLGSRLRRAVPLAPMTTYRVGGAAALFLEATSIDDLVAVADVRAATGLPVLVIGRGSNTLVADSGFRGLALTVAGFADHIDIPALDGLALATPVEVAVGGGVALPVFARRTAAAGLTGFEWAVGVPGSIGGAVRMNAGGHGSDMAATLLSVDAFDLDGAGRHELPAARLGLRFRASDLGPASIVLGARLRLATGDRAAAEAEIADIVRWRRDHQPGGQNCGSVFVNPIPGEVSAGALIDGLGLRGFRIGAAWVSEKHANFIQAGEGCPAADVQAVLEAVRDRVAAHTGYRLRSEVRLVGFDDADPSSCCDAPVDASADTPADTVPR